MQENSRDSEKPSKRARTDQNHSIKSTKRVKAISSIVSNLYTDKASADVTLVSGNTEVPCHRCILSSIPYFKEKSDKKSSVINLTNEVPEEVLKDIVEYIYCGTICITANNAIALLRLSLELNLRDLSDHLSLRLIGVVKCQNCIQLFEQIDKLPRHTSRVIDSSRMYITKYFGKFLNDIMKTKEFYNLSVPLFERIMTESKRLDERMGFEALIEYLEHHPTLVQTYLRPWLKKLVRLEKLPYNYLGRTVMTHPMLLMQGTNNTNPFSDLICDALCYQIGKNEFTREAYNVSFEEGPPLYKKMFEGCYVIEKNPNGSGELYARMPGRNYILHCHQDESSKEFWISFEEDDRLLRRSKIESSETGPYDLPEGKSIWYDDRNKEKCCIAITRVVLKRSLWEIEMHQYGLSDCSYDSDDYKVECYGSD